MSIKYKFLIPAIALFLSECAFAGHFIVLLGPPGAGKGTLGKKLSEELNIPFVDSWRNYIVDKKSKQHIRDLKLVNRADYESVKNQILLKRLLQEDCANGVILDDWPKNEKDFSQINNYYFKNRPVTYIRLLADPDELLRRGLNRSVCTNLECGEIYGHQTPETEDQCDLCGAPLKTKDKDNEELFPKRIIAWENSWVETKSWLEERDFLLTDIDTHQRPDDVLQETLKVLKTSSDQ